MDILDRTEPCQQFSALRKSQFIVPVKITIFNIDCQGFIPTVYLKDFGIYRIYLKHYLSIVHLESTGCLVTT